MNDNRSRADSNKQADSDQSTQWSFERTKLAKERTLAAWIRTGLAISAAGSAIAKFLPVDEPKWIIRSISVTFSLLEGLTFTFGF